MKALWWRMFVMQNKLWWSLRQAMWVIEYKWWVFVAWMRMDCRFPFWWVITHSLSSFSLAELPHFGRMHFGDADNISEYVRARRHHIEHNPYDPVHWVIRVEDRKLPAPMPAPRIRELIASWMAMYRMTTGEWFINHHLLDVYVSAASLDMHPDSREILLANLWRYFGYKPKESRQHG